MYLSNPSYLLARYADNKERVQSALLQIRSASAKDPSWATIRNLSAVESSLVGL